MSQASTTPRHRVLAKIKGAMGDRYDEVLTPDALLFLADLERRFGSTRRILPSMISVSAMSAAPMLGTVSTRGDRPEFNC